MVGKIKRVRPKLHQDAVKIKTEEKTPSGLEAHQENARAFPLNIFTKPEAQVNCSNPAREVKVSVCFNEEQLCTVIG